MVVVSHLFFFLRKYFRGRCDSGESHRPLSGTIYFPTAPSYPNVPERIRTAGLPLRRRTLYPAELQKHMHHMHFTAGRNSYGPQYIITYIGKKIKPQISKFPASTPGL